MGHRKSAKKATSKAKVTIPKVFKCPYCSHESSCEVKMNKVAETGTIECRVCGESFQCRISYLSDPVDVYCEWIDACESARDGEGNGGAAAAGAGAGGEAEDEL